MNEIAGAVAQSFRAIETRLVDHVDRRAKQSRQQVVQRADRKQGERPTRLSLDNEVDIAIHAGIISRH
jgi:hypothetical protein